MAKACQFCGRDTFSKYCERCRKQLKNQPRRLRTLAVCIRNTVDIVNMLKRMAESQLIEGAPLNNINFEIERLQFELATMAEILTVRLNSRGRNYVKMASPDIQSTLPRVYSGADGEETLPDLRNS